MSKEKMVMQFPKRKGITETPPAPLPPLLPKHHKPVPKVVVLPPPPSLKRTKKSTPKRVPLPPPLKPCNHPYYYPTLRKRPPQVTLDLLSSMVAGGMVPVQVRRENPPSNETLKAWASSLRLGDGRKQIVDLSLKLRVVKPRVSGVRFNRSEPKRSKKI
ncbi:hypothetical protein JHK87_007347 [Glycine soja]|nr:hypothetical protein JHK87_007347 [Glycine soja]